jgi:glycopeptide antibiotics resistance protein
MLHQVLKPTLIILSLSIPAWILFRMVLRNLKAVHSISYKKELILLLFVLYTAFVLCLTLLPVPATRVDNPNAMDINVVPVINTVKQSFDMFSRHNTFKRLHVIENILGNFIMFIPLGIFLRLLFPKCSLKRTIVLAFICSVSIELIQLIGRQFGNYRTVDIDDIILNTTGAILGFIIARQVFRKKN